MHAVHAGDFQTPANAYTGSEDSMYACEQFCMNPDTIADLKQQAQCFDCLDKFRAEKEKNVAPCGLCMTAITADVFNASGEVYVRRAQCMTCVTDFTTSDPNKDWACVECAKITGTTASTKCLLCLKEEWVDPCACVEGVKRGWLFHDPSGTCVVTTDWCQQCVRQRGSDGRHGGTRWGLINGCAFSSPSPGPSNAALLVTRISVPLTSGVKYDWPGSC
ncbi:hypothetical protein FOA52_003318 [Chlamydomonas sp. UWO 241]|nr:hypothetical protein FOA52_003318 [Chlamydomonas sp. UWO 241]